MLTQPTLRDMWEPRNKRQRRAQSTLQDVARLLSSILEADDLCSLVASFMTVPELVMASCVSHRWLQRFSQPGCWRHTTFRSSRDHAHSAYSMAKALVKMPQLQALKLDYPDDDPIHDWLDARASRACLAPAQPTMPHSFMLRKLHVSGQVDASVLHALPQLEEFEGNLDRGNWYTGELVSNSSVVFPPALRRLWDRMSLEGTLMDSLLRNPPTQLQHIGKLRPTPHQLRQLVAVCPQLATVHISTPEHLNELQLAEFITALIRCKHLTDLTIDWCRFGPEATQALCSLSQLRTLRLCNVVLSTSFLQRLSDVHFAMVSHLPREQQGNQQMVEISIHGEIQLEADDGEYDAWWLAALHAHHHCNRLVIQPKYHRAPDAVLRQYLAETECQLPTSLLRTMDCHNFAYVKPLQLLQFTQRHCDLTCIDISGRLGWKAHHVSEVLSIQPALTRLTVSSSSPAIVQSALTASGALRKLAYLDIKAEYLNNDCDDGVLVAILKLLEAADGLRRVSVDATSVEWHKASSSDIQRCTRHLEELRVAVIDVPATAFGWRKLRPAAVIAKLLLLPSLCELFCPEPWNKLAGEMVERSTRAKGTNRVKLDTHDYLRRTDWHTHHCTGDSSEDDEDE